MLQIIVLRITVLRSLLSFRKPKPIMLTGAALQNEIFPKSDSHKLFEGLQIHFWKPSQGIIYLSFKEWAESNSDLLVFSFMMFLCLFVVIDTKYIHSSNYGIITILSLLKFMTVGTPDSSGGSSGLFSSNVPQKN